MAATSGPPGPGSGVGVDAGGWPVRDPTQNVIEILATAVKRLDDLREKDAQHAHELMELRAQHTAEMRVAETARIDAIRAVDVGAVNRAAEVSAAQAQALASQVATSAETLRTQVAAAAQAATVALAAALEPIQKDVQDLRRVQYEQQGQRASASETKVDRRAGVGQGLLVASVVVAVISTLAAMALGILAAVGR